MAIITQVIEALTTPERLPIVGAVVAAVALALLVSTLLRFGSDSLSAFPHFNKEAGSESEQRADFLSHATALYTEGARMFTDSAFRITTGRSSPVICVPAKFLPQMNKLGDDVLSFPEATTEQMHAKYTGLATKEDRLVHMVKADLTPALRRLNPIIHEEVNDAMRSAFGDCDDWTELTPNNQLLQVVAQVSGRIFVGEELCREPGYLKAAVHYTVDLMEAVRAVTLVSPWKRFFRAPGLPDVKTLHKHEEDVIKLLKPTIDARLKALADPNSVKPDDLLQWGIDRLSEKGPIDPRLLTTYQLTITFAAIHTTTLSTTNALYTLASMPKVLSELRAEIRDTLAAHDGVFTSNALQALKKLDSFVREDMRMHPLGPVTFSRRVLKPFTLSNGQVVPVGVVVEVPTIGVNRDDSVYPNADTFDHLRFYKNRGSGPGTESASASARNQMVSVNTEHLTFGFGRHACPGRFFAANEIKMILSTILMKYDVELVGSTERYPNIEIAGQLMPDPFKTLRFKRAEY